MNWVVHSLNNKGGDDYVEWERERVGLTIGGAFEGGEGVGSIRPRRLGGQVRRGIGSGGGGGVVEAAVVHGCGSGVFSGGGGGVSDRAGYVLVGV